ncbi:MAG: YerC/YecD family TrpR-related protein [Patescibacteria group bacterium]|nr:YerC/YecD family TrpR-related protein [Patescibacteria group bacterium]
MSKVKYYSVSKKERYQLVGEFFDIVYYLKTKKEIIDFFIGLLTTSESLMVARRIQIAKLIIQGETYEKIRKKLGVGCQTIQKVDRWLHERDGAYLNVLENYMNRAGGKDKRMIAKTYKPKELLDRYPQHKFLKKMLGL